MTKWNRICRCAFARFGSGLGCTVVFLFLLLTVAVQGAWADDVWSGDGSELNPYVVSDVAGLNQLAANVNSGNEYESTYFVLDGDIDYSQVPLTLDGGKGNFTAIGLGSRGPYIDAKPFRGHFDGKGYTIKGICIYKGKKVKR